MRIVLILITVLLSACQNEFNPIYGPCVHYYLDPIIEIKSVSEEVSGQSIPSFTITNAMIDGLKIDLHALVNDVSFNTVFYDSALYCSAPCGFGSEEGEYRLAVSAIGYRDTIMTFNARYRKFQGGCPSSNSGSTVLSFQMRKK